MITTVNVVRLKSYIHTVITGNDEGELLWLNVTKYLLLGDVDRLVEDQPCDSLVARRHCCRAIVRHIVVCLW